MTRKKLLHKDGRDEAWPGLPSTAQERFLARVWTPNIVGNAELKTRDGFEFDLWPSGSGTYRVWCGEVWHRPSLKSKAIKPIDKIKSLRKAKTLLFEYMQEIKRRLKAMERRAKPSKPR